MTPDEIDKLEAGPELDALIAEKVMGHQVIRTPHLYPKFTEDTEPNKKGGRMIVTTRPLAEYSTRIEEAWDVVEKSRILKTYYLQQSDVGSWRIVSIFADYNSAYENEVFAEAPTAPLAICRAALKAVTK